MKTKKAPWDWSVRNRKPHALLLTEAEWALIKAAAEKDAELLPVGHSERERSPGAWCRRTLLVAADKVVREIKDPWAKQDL